MRFILEPRSSFDMDELRELHQCCIAALNDAFRLYPNAGTYMVSFNYRYAYIYQALDKYFSRKRGYTCKYNFRHGIEVLAKELADTSGNALHTIEAYAHACHEMDDNILRLPELFSEQMKAIEVCLEEAA